MVHYATHTMLYGEVVAIKVIQIACFDAWTYLSNPPR